MHIALLRCLLVEKFHTKICPFASTELASVFTLLTHSIAANIGPWVAEEPMKAQLQKERAYASNQKESLLECG